MPTGLPRYSQVSRAGDNALLQAEPPAEAQIIKRRIETPRFTDSRDSHGSHTSHSSYSTLDSCNIPPFEYSIAPLSYFSVSVFHPTPCLPHSESKIRATSR